MKREPYIITEHLTVQEITDLINRAYNEGFEDGKKEATTITFPGYGEITTPLKDIQIQPNAPTNPWTAPNNPWINPITPNDWPPSVIYCNSGDVPEAHYGDGKIHDVKVGDVITYRSMDSSYYGILITHRVVDIKSENGKTKYVTKGDNNETVDRSPIEFGQITGKVVMRIPKVGYLKYFLVSSYGWIFAIVIPSVCIIAYDIFKLIRNIVSPNGKYYNKDKERKV